MMNKKRIGFFFLFVCFTFATMVLNAEETKKSGLEDVLVKNLSLKPEQATGAAGSVFSLAKSKMSAADFTKLAGGFPEMDSLLKAVPKTESSGMGSVSSALGSQAGPLLLASQFKSLGISPEIASKVVPEVLNFVKGKQGDAMMGLLSKAVK
jgi:hypothetical protein